MNLGIPIILAAGSSDRFGEDKLSFEVSGMPLILHTLEAFLEIRRKFKEILIVINPENKRIKEILQDLNVTIIENRQSKHDGMSSSILRGIEYLLHENIDLSYLMIHPGDIPKITSLDLSSIITNLIETKRKILIPTFKGSKGHPIGLSGDLTLTLLEIDEVGWGMKGYLNKNLDLINYLELTNQHILDDIDTKTDLNKLFNL